MSEMGFCSVCSPRSDCFWRREADRERERAERAEDSELGFQDALAASQSRVTELEAVLSVVLSAARNVLTPPSGISFNDAMYELAGVVLRVQRPAARA